MFVKLVWARVVSKFSFRKSGLYEVIKRKNAGFTSESVRSYCDGNDWVTAARSRGANFMVLVCEFEVFRFKTVFVRNFVARMCFMELGIRVLHPEMVAFEVRNIFLLNLGRIY